MQKKEGVKCILIYILLLIVLVFINVEYENELLSKYDGKIFPNTKINNIDVTGYTYDEFEKIVKQIDKNIEKTRLNININEEEHIVTLKEIGYSSDYKKISKEIIDSYKGYNRIQKIEKINSLDKNEYYIKMDVDYKKVNDVVEKLAKESKIEPIDPTASINNNEVCIKKGKIGKIIQQDKLVRAIELEIDKKYLQAPNIQINTLSKDIESDISIEELQKIDTKISTYVTYHGSGGGRLSNLEVAADKINNEIIMPGEEFSYCDTVGPVDYENGYKNAPVIVNGKLQDGVGGGICQVSTTMYNAQLRAGILPVERRNHSKKVGYAKMGLDATVYSGLIDYKFENTLDYPILVNSYITNNQVVVEFWSNKEATNDIEFEPVSYINGNGATTYLYGYDENGTTIYKELVDYSYYNL